MDRDSELVDLYNEIIPKEFVEHLSREIEKRKVEGEWYLREIVWEDGREVKIVSRIQSNGILEGCGLGATMEKLKEWGWLITPVDIYRKE